MSKADKKAAPKVFATKKFYYNDELDVSPSQAIYILLNMGTHRIYAPLIGTAFLSLTHNE